MAEASAWSLASLSLLPNNSLTREISPRLFTSSPRSSASSRFRRLSSARPSNFPIDDDPYGFYPWDPVSSDVGDAQIEWVSEDKVTLFTADGLVQIGGSLIPRRVTAAERKQGKSGVSRKNRRFQEKDYMDPTQSLCLGALFDIAATNGLDMGRKLCIIGFCRSIEMLSDVVEDAVLEHGGEIVVAEKASENGFQEKLRMTVAVPLLWGVPPASETLHLAVRSGGGIVDKVYWRWDFLK
ncbi:hypothetical protein V2J09_006619 [Rumex salicifolius]